ncbi:COMM domain-containing protein 9-like [Halichondria panicea]|uniref:COMM domain-containing protein 9-like n=1 Tax=Halichondria panicea TaxID=6063 RepID=UPI00312B4912
MATDDAASLQFLLKAQSKAVVVNVSREAFVHRGGKAPDLVVASVAKSLDIQPSDALKLLTSLGALITTVLYEGLADSASIATLFPENFHKNLKGLLSDTIAKNLPDWKSQALQNQVSLPRLVDFDWRVDVKTSSDTAVRMAQPTCLLQMKISESPEVQNEMPAMRSLNVEFSKETLDTMLDGLGKIRDQLSSVAI